MINIKSPTAPCLLEMNLIGPSGISGYAPWATWVEILLVEAELQQESRFSSGFGTTESGK
jgi:hypothetical protein